MSLAANLPTWELFDRYQARLYNFFLRLTSDEEASEDLTQVPGAAACGTGF
jgi:DNA-directed RNA polymerase specialized sigma24 family protein